VFAADPKVAEVRPASPTSLFVFGIAPGRTTVAALGANGAPIAQYDVMVNPSGYGAAAARATIDRALPGQNVQVQTLGNGIAVSGEVATPAEADRAVQIARGYVGEHQTVENRLSVLASQQVNLRVRIAEMSRNLTRTLGVNWQSLANLGRYAAIGVLTANTLPNITIPPSIVAGAGYNFNTPGHVLDVNALIDALAQDQLIHVLAEPNLTAISGETASFLVGGEFPIPVAQQNNSISIEFKQYGVSLAFIPTVSSGGRINMKVRPEVSALSDQGAVVLSAANSSIQVPALTVRRAETTVELTSGQSFAIAGLLQDSTQLTGKAVPFLGEVPILGALFRSDGFQRNETELVIVVTPYLVRPTSDPAGIKLPTDGWRPPTDLERILLLRQSGRAQTAATPVRIPGDAGFIVQ
jgi:pilus assembly protein CpaC